MNDNHCEFIHPGYTVHLVSFIWHSYSLLINFLWPISNHYAYTCCCNSSDDAVVECFGRRMDSLSLSSLSLLRTTNRRLFTGRQGQDGTRQIVRHTWAVRWGSSERPWWRRRSPANRSREWQERNVWDAAERSSRETAQQRWTPAEDERPVETDHVPADQPTPSATVCTSTNMNTVYPSIQLMIFKRKIN